MITTIISLIATGLRWCFAQQPIRDELDTWAVTLIHDVLFKSDSDPVYQQKYLSLSSQLVQAVTPEEKRVILTQIRALRSGTAPLPQ